MDHATSFSLGQHPVYIIIAIIAIVYVIPGVGPLQPSWFARLLIGDRPLTCGPSGSPSTDSTYIGTKTLP
jgi:hypothetical protein